MISAVIVTYNEGEKLKSCLESISFAEEVIVVDLGSTDITSEVCRRFKVRVFNHRQVPFVEEIRNFAISKAVGDWILVLDPDERLTGSLAIKLQEITGQDKYQAVNIPRKNIFFGKWIRHTNWWPDRHIRFFKKGSVEWDTKIHSYPKVTGKVLDLEAKPELSINHYGYDSIKQFIDRQNRYSEIEAKQRFEAGERFNWLNFFWWPSREFLVRFVKHGGFLDGFYGFTLTFLMMVYWIIVLVKLWEKGKV